MKTSHQISGDFQNIFFCILFKIIRNSCSLWILMRIWLNYSLRPVVLFTQLYLIFLGLAQFTIQREIYDNNLKVSKMNLFKMLNFKFFLLKVKHVILECGNQYILKRDKGTKLRFRLLTTLEK